MNEIPLKVLIIDPERSTAESLQRALRDIETVITVERQASLAEAPACIETHDINAIYIDPISLGIEEASDFIFRIRQTYPEIVFVLYYSFEEQESYYESSFYAGERRRFRHYFRLDKLTSVSAFSEEVRYTALACEADLAATLTQEKIASLQQELTEIQEGASDENVIVSVGILERIQEQLAALKAEKRTPGTLEPAQFLGPLASPVKPDRCFVIMPYSESWSESVEDILRESCEAAGFEFTIAKTMEGRFIPHDIWQGITGSGVMIADLTGANANVTYEVGLADAIGREVVLLCQDTEVPFDFLGQRLIVYKDSIAGGKSLKSDLTDRLVSIKDRFASR